MMITKKPNNMKEITRDILEGNKLIAEFMGLRYQKNHKHTIPNEQWNHDESGISFAILKYHTSWGRLMPACQRWDNTWHDEWDTHQVEKYTSLSDELDRFATLYEIEPLWRQLVINIKWYNQNHQ